MEVTEPGAAGEGVVADGSDGVGDGYGREPGAVAEGGVRNSSDFIANIQCRKIYTIVKYRITIRPHISALFSIECHGSESGAAVEGP